MLTLAASGCTMEAIPATITPREMVLPYLSKECMNARARSTPVRLLSKGAEPRQKLRFQHREQQVSIKLMTEAPLDQAGYTIDTEWIGVGGRAQGCHQFEVSGPRTRHIGDPVVGVAKITQRGNTTYATDALDAKSYEVERDLAWALDRVDPVVPNDPVGVGAVWRAKAESQRSGEVLEIDVYYRITSIEQTRVVLEVVRSVHRPAQRIRGPRGFSKRVDALTTHERGIIDFDLRSRPIPNGRFWDEKGNEVVRIFAAYR